MFDLTSSKLLLLAVVALLVIGPKDFPLLLRTIGKYVGIIRGHAKEFRAQFDEAMRESELTQLKSEMENLGKEAEATLKATKDSVEETFTEARQSLETSVETATATDAPPSADLLPAASMTTPAQPELPPTDATPPPEATPEPPAPAAQTAAAAAPAVERTGA